MDNDGLGVRGEGIDGSLRPHFIGHHLTKTRMHATSSPQSVIKANRPSKLRIEKGTGLICPARRLIAKLRIPTDKLGCIPLDRLLGDRASIRRIVLEVTGKNLLDLKTTECQDVKVQDGRLVVTLARAVAERLQPSPEEVSENLAATFAYPSDHEKIQDLAKLAMGDAKTDMEKVRRLVDFISDFIDYGFPAEPLTIWNLIEEREGDCSENALLFTVLARAVGLPAREVGGLVYAGDEHKMFPPHAWNKVVINGQWVPVDLHWMNFRPV